MSSISAHSTSTFRSPYATPADFDFPRPSTHVFPRRVRPIPVPPAYPTPRTGLPPSSEAGRSPAVLIDYLRDGETMPKIFTKTACLAKLFDFSPNNSARRSVATQENALITQHASSERQQSIPCYVHARPRFAATPFQALKALGKLLLHRAQCVTNLALTRGYGAGT
ncbi:hypothetical protein EXIGLDRAFT_369091 [Exidia glandulosa HHB12029]|uniref:Uncharacterized protein n=1 Tax=Exidia glandulosa HHB12029 TaxID=1314781 RepID=A0A165C2M5_EXIGL|nr:hypothetical protein EXIGLDRAFT_369091 [Exidia glandulosa HHB12029]